MAVRPRADVLARGASARLRSWSRARKSRWLTAYTKAHEIESVLLVGAGGGDEPWENVVERSVAALAAFSVWCGTERRANLPRYVVCDGRALPFRSRSFDLVFSNAVVEHVGGEAEQLHFIREHQRVGRWWAATTPNRWFPLESHTMTAFRHWSPRWRSRQPQFTRLLSRRELAELLPTNGEIRGTPLDPTFTAYRTGTAGERDVSGS